MWLRPVIPDRTDRSFHADRNHHQAFYEGAAIGIYRNARIIVDVLDDSGLPVQHGPSTDTGRYGKPLAFPEGTDGVLIGIEAPLFVPKNERSSVRTRQLTSCAASHLHDGIQRARQ